VTQKIRAGDPEAMRELARLFDRNAGKPGGVVNALNGRMVNSDRIWSGPAAERFPSEWNDAKAAFDKDAPGVAGHAEGDQPARREHRGRNPLRRRRVRGSRG
jgi:uncharacterized protein YukE